MIKRLLTNGCLAAMGLLLLAVPLSADDLDHPKGTPILVVSGGIGSTNVGDTAVFDRDMLEALGTESIVTRTPWFDGETEFRGVRLDVLMDVVGAEGQSLTAVALNDYVTTIPMQDLSEFGVILALQKDGEYMSVRDKGPLFIIYPFDSNPDLQAQTYFARAAWQVAKLIVE